MRKALEIAREKVFWCNDALKGAAFRRHYDEIARNLTAVEQDVASRNLRKLTSLLNHASSSVPYYRGISAGANLEDFPIVSKTTIRENFNAFISNTFTEEQQIATVTSGSTGTPFKVLQHRDKKIRNQADTLYFARLTGYRVGDRLLYLKIWSDNNRKSQWANLLQNLVPVDVISFNDSEVARLVDNMQRDGSTYAMLGYSSAIEQICRWLDKVGHGPVRTKLSSAISMSETLNDYTKQTIQKYFGVPVYSRYSNLENGILAQQIPSSDSRYLINTASYVIEVVKMTNEMPASPGELGRIVVTDLYNRLMPMIRYDTGDIGALSESSDAYGNRYLDLVEGRKLDLLFATDGSLVSSYIVYKNMWQYTEITQYQLIQYGSKDYLFKINMDGTFDREQKLIGEFKRYLGQDANFQVEYVKEIPLLSSGKRKKIANTYHTSIATTSSQQL